MGLLQVVAFSAAVIWNTGTLVKIHDATYGRMIRSDGDHLVAGYETGGYVAVKHSYDNGRSWLNHIPVGHFPQGNAANAELVALQDGRLLLTYNERSPTGDNGIAIAYSTDKGYNWSPPVRLWGGGPMWEPAAIQLPDGSLHLYFADESPYPNSNDQNISRLRSSDGGRTWQKPVRTSYRPGSRDGMPVPERLHNGHLVVAIEDPGMFGTFKPVIVEVPAADDSNLPIGDNASQRWSALMDMLPQDTYAGAPYVKQLPAGPTVLSFQIKRPGESSHRMMVFIGDENARNFASGSYPFAMADANVDQLWPSVFAKSWNTVTALVQTRIHGEWGLWAIDGTVN